MITILSFVISSCSEDFLDRNNLNGAGEETFFKTENDANQALIAVYGRLQSGTFSSNIPLYGSIADNMLTPALNSGFAQFAEGTEAPGDGGAGIARWSECYAGIFRANFFLANASNVEMDSNDLNRMNAEATFLRAFYYYNLIYFFGDVPLLLEPISIDEAIAITRTDKETVVTIIMNDLDFALANLPESTSEYGRVTKVAAAALRTRILLYEKDYPSVITNAQAIMNGTYGDFTLFPDFETLFREVNEGNSEVLWDIQFSSIEQIGQGAPWDNGYQSDSKSAAVLPNLVEAFNSTNGLSIDDPLNTLYDSNFPYDNRDPRMKASIHIPGEQWGDLGTWPEYRTGSPTSFPWAPETKYAMKKYMTPETEAPNNIYPNGTNFIVFRYADILLMYAEAKIESGSIDQSTLDAINDVRARAYGTTKEDTMNYPEVTTTSQSELTTILRKERRVEFAIEGLRWLDLVRWDELEVVRTAINRSFQANIWPIPSTEIQIAPGLTQNAPWN